MSLSKEIQSEIYRYCTNHLADEDWYSENFEFIEDEKLRKRLVQEFKAIRFAYKLYEGIEAEHENLIFEIRQQLLSYASIYEAVIHHVLYTYYSDTDEFHELQYHTVPTRISIPENQKTLLASALLHRGEMLIPCRMQERKKEERSIRFENKCQTAEQLGLIHEFENSNGEIIDLPKELIEIYSYRNAIHLIAELKKGLDYELELSKKAYRRMRPFIDQIKEKLKHDKKGIYS